MAAATVRHHNHTANVVGLLRNVGVLAALWVAYSSAREISGPAVRRAFDNATSVVGFQQSLGLDLEPQIQSMVGFTWLFRVANWYYLVHFPVTIAAVLSAYFVFGTSSFTRLRNSLIGATGVALLVHSRYPLAPPRMLDGYLDTAAVFGPNPYALPGSDNANQFAAMPSMHVGWAVLVALLLWSASSHRSLRIFGVVHATMTAAVVIVTANHYVLDVLIGAGLAGLAWAATGLVQSRRDAQRELDARLERIGVAESRS